VCNTGGRPELEGERIEALLEQRVDGIALLDFTGDRGVLSQLLAARVPAVMVSCWAEYADCVAVDDVEGIDLAVGHLVGLGHRDIAHVVDPVMEATTRRARVAAFERSLLRHGVEVRPEWVGPDAPSGATAVVAANDYTALALIERLEGRGVSVPGDVSVVGFDGIEIGALRRMALTTVAQPGFELARRGVEMLLRRIDRGHDAPPEQQRLSPWLIVRGSTRAV
jgi:LacI family transcriptional regulator